MDAATWRAADFYTDYNFNPVFARFRATPSLTSPYRAAGSDIRVGTGHLNGHHLIRRHGTARALLPLGRLLFADCRAGLRPCCLAPVSEHLPFSHARLFDLITALPLDQGFLVPYRSLTARAAVVTLFSPSTHTTLCAWPLNFTTINEHYRQAPSAGASTWIANLTGFGMAILLYQLVDCSASSASPPRQKTLVNVGERHQMDSRKLVSPW